MNAKNLVLAAMFALSATQLAQAQSPSSYAPVPELTRAEVIADLLIYRESGLAELDRLDGVNWNSPDYREAAARYARLRSSPKFAQLVERIAAHREGERAAH